jgi:hypothetical protein
MFYSFFSSESLALFETPEELALLKEYRTKCICQSIDANDCNTNKYHCYPCKMLKVDICKAYHRKDKIQQMTCDEAADELALRIVYEYIFDIIPSLEYLENEKWLDSSLRDNGHHRRIVLLYKRSKNSTKYKWLWP